jgi:hypothetical protein
VVPAKRYVVCTPTTVRTPSTLVQPLPSRSTSASSVASWVRNRRPGDGSSSRGGLDRRDRMTGWHVVKIVRRRRQLRALVWPPAVYGASPWESVGDSSPFAVEGSLFDSGLRPDDHGGWVGRGVGRRPLVGGGGPFFFGGGGGGGCGSAAIVPLFRLPSRPCPLSPEKGCLGTFAAPERRAPHSCCRRECSATSRT